MRYLLFILLFLFSVKIYAQSRLCASNPTNFCCEYVSSVTINGKTYNGSTGYSNTSGGSPAGYYDYTSNAVPTITAAQTHMVEVEEHFMARLVQLHLRQHRHWTRHITSR